MYISLKNKIENYIFGLIKKNLEKISDKAGKEEIYYWKNENKELDSFIVFVKDEDLGLKISKIVKELKKGIDAYNLKLKVTKIVFDKYERVQLIYIDSDIYKSFSKDYTIDILQDMTAVTSFLEEKGYVIDESKFNSKTCTCFSEFLSFFTLNTKVEDSKAVLVKYIHYRLANHLKNLYQYYDIIDNVIDDVFKIKDFPYHLPIIKMCYNYYSKGILPNNIYEILRQEKFDGYYGRNDNFYCIPDIQNFERKNSANIIEKTDEYTLYKNDVKIYNEISKDFSYFLKSKYDSIKFKDYVLEGIYSKIIDLDENIIGYKISEKRNIKTNKIFDKDFKTQSEIIDFVKMLYDFVCKITITPTVIHFMDLEEDLTPKGSFNIEEEILYNDENNLVNFYVESSKDLFKSFDTNRYSVKMQITIIFFKIYLKYLNKKYSDLSNAKKLLEKDEVKYLSPYLAKEFINYSLKKVVNYKIAINEFFSFIDGTAILDNKHQFYWDCGFIYNPFSKPFVFDYEIEEKYRIKIEKGMQKILPNGDTLVILKKNKLIVNLMEKEENILKQISEKIGQIESKHFKFIGISKIIYSKRLGKYEGCGTNGYRVIGYITSSYPKEGKFLTKENLLSLSNKDFLIVLAHLFTNFGKYYIDLDNIYMDNNFVFYVNVCDVKIKTMKYGSSYSHISSASFLFRKLDYFKDMGYKTDFLIDLKKQILKLNEEKMNEKGEEISKLELKRILLNYAKELTAYCREHNIYYNPKPLDTCEVVHEGCPLCNEVKINLKKIKHLRKTEFLYHYKLNDNYNIKLYKGFKENDVKNLEKNVTKIIELNLKAYVLQDCFIPYKRVVDEKTNRFIGYMYEIDNKKEENEFINLSQLDKLKNLPRLLSLIRLITQIKELINNGYYFNENPYGQVFLNKNHKKQVQIINMDYIVPEEPTLARFFQKKNLKWTYEYIKNIIESDETLEVEFPKQPKLDFLLVKLRNISKDLNSYCNIHNMYYDGKLGFCPRCIDKEMQSKLQEVKKSKMHLEYKKDIINVKSKKEGGEAFIYSYGDERVAKVFKDEINISFKEMIISLIMSKGKALQEVNNQNLKYKYIFPQKFLIDKSSSKTFGYIMEKVTGGKPISVLKNKTEVEKLGFSIKDVLEILITIGSGIEKLHSIGIYIGDLNGSNILFDDNKNVYFLDFDGMGVDCFSPEFCTDGYIDPISKSKKNITSKDDWYSFAIQAFYYLTYTHPFNGIYYAKIDNKDVNLDIVEKMKKRISLLGNHGISIPDVAVPWEDWMTKELQNAFLNIFENENRDSIVPMLIEQYEKL